MTTRDALERASQLAGTAMGIVNLTLERGKLRPTSLDHAAQALEEAARQIRQIQK